MKENTERENEALRTMETTGGALPFDRQEWARTGDEAQASLRRQYGREARTHADD